MVKQHVVLYVPGLGDLNLRNRQKLLNLWHFKRVRIEICPMYWQKNEPWQKKLDRLLARIDELYAQQFFVSLIGESAGASAVVQAMKLRHSKLNAGILLCGKTQFPDRVSSRLYALNPALKNAVVASQTAVNSLTPQEKAKMLNLHPIADPVVPVKETKIPGVADAVMPVIGHALSIGFGMSIWSFRIVKFIRSKSTQKH